MARDTMIKNAEAKEQEQRERKAKRVIKKEIE